MTEAPPRLATYTLRNVWSTGTDADTSAYDETAYLLPPGLRVSGLGRATHRAFAPAATPACDFVLPNEDGRYSPGGLLGGFVGRGPETTCRARFGTDVPVDAADVRVDDRRYLVDGVGERLLFTGAIDTAPQEIDRRTAHVQVRSLGRSARLLRLRPRIALAEHIRTDQAIALVLDAVGWPTADRLLDAGDTELLYFWANADRSAGDLLNLIGAAEGVPSCQYEDSLGRWHFEGRQFRAGNARSTEVQWQLFDGSVGSSFALVDDPLVLTDDPYRLVDAPLEALLFHIVPTQWTSNPDEVVAQVKTTVNLRTPTGTIKVWEYGGPLVLAASEVRDLEATAAAPFTAAVTPLLGTDYAVSAGAVASVALLDSSGQTARIRVTAGPGGATVLGVTSDGIQLRAVSLPTTATIGVTSTVDTDLSAARYDPQDQQLAIWPEITANQALDLANSFARRYQRPRDQLVVQLVNLDADHLYAITHMQVSDRVRIKHTRAGINQAFFIEAIEHDLSAGGGLHRLTLRCERATDDVPARFGSARFGFDHFSE